MKNTPFKAPMLGILLLLAYTTNAQNVGINTTGAAPNAAAILDLNTGNAGTTGFLPEKVALTATNLAGPIIGPPNGLLVYNTATAGVPPNNVVPGYYYNSGTPGTPNWALVLSGSASPNSWLTLGNAGTVDGTNFIGTTDGVPLTFRVGNQKSGRIDAVQANVFFGYQSGGAITAQNNTAIGNTALFSNITGAYNVAVGASTLIANTNGIDNVAIGAQALTTNVGGSDNTACGYSSLQANVSGLNNVACGYGALLSNTTASQNTATGYSALGSTVTAPDNTADGFDALKNSTYASQNTAIGSGALQTQSFTNGTAVWATNNTAVGFNALFADNPTSNANGFQNTAVGSQALTANTTGSANTSTGFEALASNTSGGSNTAVGYFGLLNNTSGIDNTTLGAQAGWSSSTASDITALGAFALKNNTAGFNTAIGYQAGQTNTLGTFNTFLGIQADASANSFINATAIGNGAVVTASNNMMFGNTSVIGWGFGATPTAGSQALVVGTNATNGNGASLTITGNWTSTSDSTKKHDIQNIRYGLSEIMKLRPVSYTWKGTDVKDIGFLAQEVKHILPEVVYGEQGHMTLSYGQITPVLTKAIQEQQKMIDDLKAENERLKNQVNTLQKAQGQNEADIALLKKTIQRIMPLQASTK